LTENPIDTQNKTKKHGSARLVHTEWPQKTGTFVRLKFIRLNLIKYWPIFKLISLSESDEHL